MHLVDDAVKPTAQSPSKDDHKSADDSRCIDAAISLLTNIVETACDWEQDLNLMRLSNLMDLYRTYLQVARIPGSDINTYSESINRPLDAAIMQNLGDTQLLSFERFIRDSHLLGMAAAAATLESGEHVMAPPPISLSAND